MNLLGIVEHHLRRSGTPPTRFGQEAMRDPRFVFDLRKGREPGAATVGRVLAHIEQRARSLAPGAASC